MITQLIYLRILGWLVILRYGLAVPRLPRYTHTLLRTVAGFYGMDRITWVTHPSPLPQFIPLIWIGLVVTPFYVGYLHVVDGDIFTHIAPRHVISYSGRSARHPHCAPVGAFQLPRFVRGLYTFTHPYTRLPHSPRVGFTHTLPRLPRTRLRHARLPPIYTVLTQLPC